MKTARIILVLVFLFGLSCYCISSLYKIHAGNNHYKISRLILLPSSVIKTICLEFPGIISDYLMLNTLSFMGEKVLQEEPTTPEEWQTIYKALQTIIDLDPRSTDPFILATTTLPWEAGLIHETNLLLEKVAKFRPHDYRPHFFIWYNYYHFLNDLEKAAIHIEKAAAIPGAPAYFKPLATRMHLYSGRIEASIIYTKETIETTNDPVMRTYLLKRLDVLKKIFLLEEKVREYKDKFTTPLNSIEDLVKMGFIETIPVDPYGGRFFVSENGQVYTTSKMVNIK